MAYDDAKEMRRDVGNMKQQRIKKYNFGLSAKMEKRQKKREKRVADAQREQQHSDAVSGDLWPSAVASAAWRTRMSSRGCSYGASARRTSRAHPSSKRESEIGRGGMRRTDNND